jgi:uncharacterized protein YndB with AHSA1/START domain
MSATEALADIRKTITVDVPVEEAFTTFTREIGAWWPVKTHSIFKEEVQEIVFDEHEGGRLYERSAAGEEGDWADVLAWDPPSMFVLRWRVNPERGATEVEVRFTPEGAGTRVDLEHRGWDETGDRDGHAGYTTGWDYVLEHFVDGPQT